MIDLYYAPTANGQRVSVMLEECGLPYRLHRLDLAKGEQRSPEYLKLNPTGLMPTLVDGDGPGGQPLALGQSGAIVLYLAEKTGRFLPKDAATRALALQWMMQAISDVAGTSGTIFRLDVTAPEKNPVITEYFKQRLLTFYRDCDRQLAGRDHLAGELSVADITLYPNFAARKALLDAAGGFEHLQRWGAAMAARPGVQKGMAPAG